VGTKKGGTRKSSVIVWRGVPTEGREGGGLKKGKGERKKIMNGEKGKKIQGEVGPFITCQRRKRMALYRRLRGKSSEKG